MTLPVYILIRTSGRPRFFARMMESIKNQTYENIITIVHTDDPRDEYVTGDIIIRGCAFGPEYGDGAYNLYNNRLLKHIPNGNGWYHFLDDDDEYASPDAISSIVEKSKRDHINVARVKRIMGGNRHCIFPDKWGSQKSYQTECFFLHTDHKGKAKWWGNKGGDHYYSKQLTRILPINWIDNLIICQAQEAKGHGLKKDTGGKLIKYAPSWPGDKMIPVVGLTRVNRGPRNEWIRCGEVKHMKYEAAARLEKEKKVKITYWTEQIEKRPVRQIYQF